MNAKSIIIVLCVLFLAANTSALVLAEDAAANPQEKGTLTIPDEENSYIIKKGDTLWHISDMFLKNPFKWPHIWKVNPYIINPDLIYPGNSVRILPNGNIVLGEKTKESASGAVDVIEGLPIEKLKKQEAEPAPISVAGKESGLPVEKLQSQEAASSEMQTTEQKQADAKVEAEEKPILQQTPDVVKVSSHILERRGIISSKGLEGSGVIIGSQTDKLLLSQGDIVYISLAEGVKATDGSKYTIFKIRNEVKHPITHKPVGYLSDTLGILEIVRTERNGTIVAEIEKSYKEILKGARLKSYEPPITEVTVKKAERFAEGLIIESMENKEGMANADIVYLDIGKNNGIDVGNIMDISRPTASVQNPMSKEKKMIVLPPSDLGSLVVIHVEDDTATAFVTKSRQVIYKGDIVKTQE